MLAAATAPPGLNPAGHARQVLRHADERAGRNLGEGDDHVDQDQPDEDEHRLARAPAHVLARDLGQRAALMTDRRRQARKVMDGADEHDAESDPEEGRHPTPVLRGEDGTGDRARGGDRRKVLAEEIKRARRHVVDAVVELVRRRNPAVVDGELSRHPTAIEPVRKNENRQKRHREKRQTHGAYMYHSLTEIQPTFSGPARAT